MLNKLNLYFSIIFFVISLVFYLNPLLDIAVMKLFYEPGIGFIYAHNLAVRFIFRAVPILTIIYVLYLICRLIIFIIKANKEKEKILLYLVVLLSFTIGSGLIVNVGLKDNFGRARPKQIIEFGAQKEFTKVYEFANQCSRNCSFSSGHAAAAFSFTTLAYLSPLVLRTRMFFAAISFGCLVGFGRIIQGGHFLSDVLTSAWIVLIINYLLLAVYEKYSKKLIKK